MSAQDVQTEILEPMQRLFLPPRNMEEGHQQSALREYVNALQNFEAEDLKAAWQAVRDTHTSRGWPVPAAFIMAAKQARKDRLGVPQQRQEGVSQEITTAWDIWQKVRASKMGRDTAEGGYAWSLKCKILYDKVSPAEIDTRELQAAHNRAQDLAARIENGSFKMRGDVRDTALSMYRHLLVKEAETQQEILRGAA